MDVMIARAVVTDLDFFYEERGRWRAGVGTYVDECSEGYDWVSHGTHPLTCRDSGCRGSWYHNSQWDLRGHRNILGQSFHLILSHARDTGPDTR